HIASASAAGPRPRPGCRLPQSWHPGASSCYASPAQKRKNQRIEKEYQQKRGDEYEDAGGEMQKALRHIIARVIGEKDKDDDTQNIGDDSDRHGQRGQKRRIPP